MRRPKRTQAGGACQNPGRNVRPIFRFEIEQNSILGGLSDLFLYQFLDSLYKSSAILCVCVCVCGGGGGGVIDEIRAIFFGLIKFLYLNNPSLGKTHKSILSYITF